MKKGSRSWAKCASCGQNKCTLSSGRAIHGEEIGEETRPSANDVHGITLSMEKVRKVLQVTSVAPAPAPEPAPDNAIDSDDSSKELPPWGSSEEVVPVKVKGRGGMRDVGAGPLPNHSWTLLIIED